MLYLPFAIMTEFANLTIFSILGIVISVFVYIIIFIDAGIYMKDHGFDFYIFEKHADFEINALLFGIILFYYEINGFITVARSSMIQPKKFH